MAESRRENTSPGRVMFQVYFVVVEKACQAIQTFFDKERFIVIESILRPGEAIWKVGCASRFEVFDVPSCRMLQAV